MSNINHFLAIVMMIIVAIDIIVTNKCRNKIYYIFGIVSLIGAMIQIIFILKMKIIQTKIFNWFSISLFLIYIILLIVICFRFIKKL